MLATIVDLNKQKSLLFMELFLYLIFLDLDKMDIYRDKNEREEREQRVLLFLWVSLDLRTLFIY